ncbi:MAG: flagellar hook-basal body complex protein FliE [Mesorhizobium sp.]|nr:flagellar hook-basal body complex protein FliE [Mesorhizobium sp.]
MQPGQVGGAAASSAADVGASFASALANAAGRTIETLQSADKISIQALQGEVPTRDVVDAVMSAEQALQTSIAIRDKIVSAYLEISRMAI